MSKVLVVATLKPQAASRYDRTVDALYRLARLDELVVVSGWAASRLAMRLGQLLPRHALVLVPARLSSQRHQPPRITNLPAIREFVEQGMLVFCLAGGPGCDRTDLVAPVLARQLHADALVRVDGDDPPRGPIAVPVSTGAATRG